MTHHFRAYLWNFGFDFLDFLTFFLGHLLLTLNLSLFFLSGLAQFFSFIAEVLIGLELFLDQFVLVVGQLRVGIDVFNLLTFLFEKVYHGLQSDIEFFDNFI